MNFLSRIFSTKYVDDQLVICAMKAITSDTQIIEPSTILASSEEGVITLDGIVFEEPEKKRIERVVRYAFRDADLKYKQLLNDLKLSTL